jgi:hypothetical protein
MIQLNFVPEFEVKTEASLKLNTLVPQGQIIFSIQIHEKFKLSTYVTLPLAFKSAML